MEPATTPATFDDGAWFAAYVGLVWFAPFLIALFRRTQPGRALLLVTLWVPFTGGLSWVWAWVVAFGRSRRPRRPVVEVVPWPVYDAPPPPPPPATARWTRAPHANEVGSGV